MLTDTTFPRHVKAKKVCFARSWGVGGALYHLTQMGLCGGTGSPRGRGAGSHWGSGEGRAVGGWGVGTGPGNRILDHGSRIPDPAEHPGSRPPDPGSLNPESRIPHPASRGPGSPIPDSRIPHPGPRIPDHASRNQARTRIPDPAASRILEPGPDLVFRIPNPASRIPDPASMGPRAPDPGPRSPHLGSRIPPTPSLGSPNQV